MHYFVPGFLYSVPSMALRSFPGGSEGKASACKAGDPVLSLGWEDPLENEMATHSGTPAWKIPWTERPQAIVHGVPKTWT